MDAFCGGETFWNETQTWGDGSDSWPQFSECFQNTVLIWVPNGYLWVAALFYIIYLVQCETKAFPNSWRNLVKLCLAVLQLIDAVVAAVYIASDLNKDGESYLKAVFFAPVIEAATLVLVIIFVELERRKGFITSGVLFMYWTLTLISKIIPFYSKIKLYNSTADTTTDLVVFVSFYIYFALTLVQFVLSCIAEPIPTPPGTYPCPETRASFLSRLTFWWSNGVVISGYKKPLSEEDMFQLNPTEESENVVPRFERNWGIQKNKLRRKLSRNVYVDTDGRHTGSKTESCELSESTPLLGESKAAASKDKSQKKEKKKVSLFKVLWKTFGWELLLAQIFKLFYDGLNYASPFLLRLLIDFTEDLTMAGWKGYVLAVAFFCTITMQSLLFHRTFHLSTSLGLRIRAALISAIFKKSLTMNNQARTESTVGEIVNLMSVDAEHIRDVLSYLWAAWSSPLNICLSLYFLYTTVGLSMFAGFGVMVILIPVNGFIMTKIHSLQERQMAQKDNRIKLITEILNGIKILKLYAWELAFGSKVDEIRGRELKILRKSSIISAFMTFSWTVAPFLVGLATFGTYVFVNKDHRLDAATAFVALNLFNVLKFAMNYLPMMMANLAKVGLATFATYVFVTEDHRLDAATAFVALTLFNILKFGMNVLPIMIAEVTKVGLTTFATYIFVNADHRLDAATAFVAISYFNILRFATLMFPWMISEIIKVGLTTFATYIFVKADHRLDPATAFVAISYFNILRFATLMFPGIISEIIKAAVSVKRINKFLNHDDLDFRNVSHNPSNGYPITIENGTFSWDQTIGPCLKGINIKVPAGKLVAVVGQVGAGKSSLLSALLGEMEKNTGQVNVEGTTAYVPQQAWIQNATLRDNILFGNVMRGDKYEAVLEACALKPDLEIFQAKDLTEIGEKGINLSGGQKQRVSLARAVYFDSDIYLLDDPLSAVDSHVGKHIFDQVVGSNGLLRNKTRVLVTHGVHWLPNVDLIIVLSDGAVSEVGSYEELMEHDGAFAQFLRTYLTNTEQSEDEDDPLVQEFKAKTLQRLTSIQSDGQTDSESASPAKKKLATTDRTVSMFDEEKARRKLSKQESVLEREKIDTKADKLIEEEKLEEGRVKWSVVVAYGKALGLKFALLIFLLYALYEFVSVYASIWLSNWTGDAELQNLTLLPGNSTRRRERNDYYLGIYGALGAAQAIMVLSYSTTAIIRMVQASAHLHRNMLTNVLRGPMAFFDTTPVGRIVNRFSQDIDTIDNQLPMQLEMWLDSLFVCIATIIVISYSTPIFLALVFPMGVLYFIIQRFFIPTSRQLKRLESKTRSPIYNNFSESLTGAPVIRAFKVRERFADESEKRVDKNQQFAFANYSVNRWLGFRLEVLGAFAVLGAAIFAVLARDTISGAIVGLSISYALQICENMNWLVRMTSDLETNIVAVERVNQYTESETEAELISFRRPRPRWPEEGKVELNSYSTRYRDGLDLVLKHITVAMKAGEKVGIVGRTGAGKSSLTLSLFRLVEPAEGTIVVDGENISRLGLHDLRSRLTILPQDPIIFSGSLRFNLDPLDRHKDAEIWVALEHAHLKSFVQSLPTQLEYECGEGGQNLSVGQRQLMCLARSLLRKTKILVLDEATAAVDMETDDLIQQTINKEFQDCTVLTIAHRLNTVIDYDRILVLDKGEVKEFDAPEVLLQDTNSMFYKMAKDAGIV